MADAKGIVDAGAAGGWWKIAIGFAYSVAAIFYKKDEPGRPTLHWTTMMDIDKSATLDSALFAGDHFRLSELDLSAGRMHNQMVVELVQADSNLFSRSFDMVGRRIKEKAIHFTPVLMSGGWHDPTNPADPPLFPPTLPPGAIDVSAIVFDSRILFLESALNDTLEIAYLPEIRHPFRSDEFAIISSFCEGVSLLENIDDVIAYTNGFIGLLEESDLQAETISSIKTAIGVALYSKYLWVDDGE